MPPKTADRNGTTPAGIEAPILPEEIPATSDAPPAVPKTPLEEIEAGIAQVEEEFRQLEANLNRNRGVLMGLMFAKQSIEGKLPVAPENKNV